MTIDPTHAILFDHDGVLVDSEPLHRVAWEATFEPKGIAVSEEDYTWSVGRRDLLFAARVSEKYRVDLSPAEIVDEKRRHLQTLLATKALLLPGISDLVQRLGELYPLGVASSAVRHDIHITLTRFDLEKHFRVVIGAEDVTRHKPDPQPYLIAAERLGVEPGRCVVLEDSITGIQSAKAAGARVIGVAGTFPAERIRPFTDTIVTSLADTPRILALIESLFAA